MEFKKGSWYKYYDYKTSFFYHFCFERIEGRNIYACNDFYLSSYKKGDNNILNLDCPVFTWYDKDFIYEEVDYSVVISLLPLNHPKRIIFRKIRINKLLNIW